MRTPAAIAWALLWGGCTLPDYEVQVLWRDHDYDGDGYTEDQGDCDDENSTRYPGAPEQCGDIDYDCDGLVDGADDDVTEATLWYVDADADEHGDPDGPVRACDQPEGYVADSTDCDDEDPLSRVLTTFYGDADADGFGGYVYVEPSCLDLTRFGLVREGGDCNDVDPDVNPETVWYPDADRDGLGDAFGVQNQGCSREAGWSRVPYDCDDNDASVGECPWRGLGMADYFACGVRGNGLLACWGDLYDGVLAPPQDEPFIAVDPADFPNSRATAACAIAERDARLVCWGGVGTEESALLDDIPTREGGFVQVSVGSRHACALATDGAMVCWGVDTEGSVSGERPGVRFVQVLAGEDLTLALDEDGQLWHWGNGLDFPNFTATNDTTLPASCGVITDGDYVEKRRSAQCEEDLLAAQLGGLRFVSIGADRLRVCGVLEGGAVRCAGAAADRVRGGETELPMGLDPVLIGKNRSCGIDENGIVFCAGVNATAARTGAIRNRGRYTQLAVSFSGNTDCALWESRESKDDPFGIDCFGANDEGEGDPPED